MPDPRDPGRAEREAAKQARYNAEISEYQAVHDLDNDTHLAAAAIVNCGLCDENGYRGLVVCDHQDHEPAAKRGMELIRQALQRGDQ